MAEKAEETAPEEGAKPASGGGLKALLGNLPVMVGLLSSLATLGTLGFVAYAKLIFKRPPITEYSERQRLELRKKQKVEVFNPGYIKFEKFLAHIKPEGLEPRFAGESRSGSHPKLRYLSVAFVLEVGDESQASKIEDVKPQFMDALISTLGRKTYAELNTLQGRYLLRNEIVDQANELVKKPIVTNVFFTDFVLN